VVALHALIDDSLARLSPAPPGEITMTTDRKTVAFWLVLLAAAGTFALTMGTRQTMGCSSAR
jgi:hypothetical protein